MKETSVGLGVGLPFAALSRPALAAGFGPLLGDPNGIFELPEGFSYRIVQQRGQAMSDGFLAPGKMDGMACFQARNGDYIVLRNQELSAAHGDEERPFPKGSSPALPACTHDPNEPGGVVRLLLDRDTLEVKDSRLVLLGTFMNCAGGKSPWGWLSCEEINDEYEADASSDHGYAFLVRPHDDGTHPARPIRNYGRFRHEAAVVVDDTLTCYLTEDRTDGCFYRFVPRAADTPFKGVLQALKVSGSDRFALATELSQGDRVDVEWVDIDDPMARESTTRSQAQAKGAAVVVRGEGITRHGRDIYVCSTTGGTLGLGQIFRYRDAPESAPFDPSTRGTLEVVLQSDDESRLAQPDNITVAPWGDVFMCEDAVNGNQHLRVLTRNGQVYDFGRNALSAMELAGVCFSEDGKVLFVNLQHDGLMLAIQGPFPRSRPDARPPEVELGSSGCHLRAPSEGRGTGALLAGLASLAWRRLGAKNRA